MDEDIFFFVVFVLFIFLTLVTIVFASIVIFVIISHWKSQTRSISNLLICNSSVALIYHSIATSIQIPFLRTPRSTSLIFCQIQAFIHFSSSTTAAYSCFIQALARFFLIILYQRKILLTFRTSWLLIIFNWMVASGLAGGIFLSPGAYRYEPESRMCGMTSKIFATSFIGVNLAFCIPFLTTIILYAIILHHTTQDRTNSDAFVIMRQKRNVKVFRNILLFTFILSLGGVPYFISVLINLNNHSPWPLYSLSILSGSFAAALESLALFFTSIQIRTLFCTKVHLTS